MEHEPSQGYTRVRRAERHRQEAPQAAPVPAPAVRRGTETGQAPIQRTRHDRTDVERSRPGDPPRRKRKPVRRAPRRLTAAVLVTLALCVALFAANSFMQAYLNGRERERETAHRQLLAAHPLRYQELIEQYAEEYNLQPAFVAAIILKESSFNPTAESGVGARGLMQLMEDTALWIAGKLHDTQGYSFARLWDPETNIRFGCWYLSYLSKMFGGDPVTVASAYHAGQNTVANWLEDPSRSADGQKLDLEGLPDGPTKAYAGEVTRAYAVYDALYYHAFNSADAGADADAGAVPAQR